MKTVILVLVCLMLGRLGQTAWAQSLAGTIRGSVADPSGALIPGASVTIQNPVSGYSRTTQADVQGNFQFANIPFNNYHLKVDSPGFQTTERDVDVRSGVPVDLMSITLKVGTQNAAMTVADAGDLVETDPTTHTDVDRDLFARLPLESSSSSLSSLVTLATPGVAADLNGLFHGLGDHASNSFSVDGQPITDQQS